MGLFGICAYANVLLNVVLLNVLRYLEDERRMRGGRDEDEMFRDVLY
jgi:hypothetical protein